MQIPLEQYSNSIAYIYAKDRPELGIVEQINYANRSGYRFVQLSGHFLENELNKMAVYPINPDTVSRICWTSDNRCLRCGNMEVTSRLDIMKSGIRSTIIVKVLRNTGAGGRDVSGFVVCLPKFC